MVLTHIISSAWSIRFSERITFALQNDIYVYYENSALSMIISELSKFSNKHLTLQNVMLENYIELFSYGHIISIIQCDFTNFTGNLDGIKYVDVFNNINSLNYILSYNFKNLGRLVLNNCGLEIFPDWLIKFTKLRILHLDYNLLSDIPDSVKNLTKLKAISIKNNNFTRIPNVLQYLDLYHVNISYNPITIIPDFVKDMKWQHFYLNHTQIEIIPTNLDHIIIPCTGTHLDKKLIEYKGTHSSNSRRRFSKLLHVVNYTITYLAVVHNIPLDVISLVAKCTLATSCSNNKK